MKLIFKIMFVFLTLSFVVLRPSASYAYWHDHGYVGVRIGWPGPYYGYPYYPYADSYYPGYVVVSSSSYQPVVVNGVTYYVNNGVYYVYTQYGYQAVATPASATAPVVQAATTPMQAISGDSENSITINIPNGSGGYSAVVIKKSGNGFVGPQGEFYAEFPKVSQLKTMYGK